MVWKTLGLFLILAGAGQIVVLGARLVHYTFIAFIAALVTIVIGATLSAIGFRRGSNPL